MKKAVAMWLGAFAKLERDGPEDIPLRELAGMYAVASILYYRHDKPPLTDGAFDRLCGYLYSHLEEARAAGADMLEEGMLSAGSGYDLSRFVKPYHDVASWLVDTVA